jgi:hypothetical protein
VTLTINAIGVTVTAGTTTVLAGGSTNLTANVSYDILSAGVSWKTIEPTDGSCGALSNVTPASATYVAPNAVTKCNITISATSLTDNTKSASVQISVTQSYPPISIVTQQKDIASGEVGQLYAQTFVAQGGSGSFTWSIGNNNLPPGVAISANSSAEIIGMPTAAGNYSAVVQVTDVVTGLSAPGPMTYAIHIGNGNDNTNTGLLYGPYTCYYQGFRNDGHGVEYESQWQ